MSSYQMEGTSNLWKGIEWKLNQQEELQTDKEYTQSIYIVSIW